MPSPRSVARLLSAALLFACFLAPRRAYAQQQNLGHKVLGTDGLNAGVQIDPGLYLAMSHAAYTASAVDDRNGHRLTNNLKL